MGLRITTKGRGQVTIIQIDGQLAADGVPELEKACAAVEGPLCLDLANLLSTDAAGVRAIHELEHRGAAVVGVLPYIQKLLDAKPA
ncbi:MAG TPA: hypothetical protein VMT89_00670 [Candidatus Acidoferrales bacterium]|nr:hypothetical protein [Candidatus Acidoferrales bacterium]